MSLSRTLKHLYLAYLSKPPENRAIYKAIRKHQVKTIVELGVGDGKRGLTMIRLAQENLTHENQPQKSPKLATLKLAGEETTEKVVTKVRYTGVDLFEANPDAAKSISLMKAHRLLKSGGAKVKLIPGDPYSALARAANTLVGTDLITISADLDRDSLDRAWFYLPRMLHENSQVFVQYYQGEKQETVYKLLSHDKLNDLAGRTIRQVA